MKSIAVIIAASGDSQRFSQNSDEIGKIFAPINNDALIIHTIKCFCQTLSGNGWKIDAILPVLRAQDMDRYQSLAFEDGKLLMPVVGGTTRQQSVKNGLIALHDATPKYDYVLIHDGARPCVGQAQIIQLCDYVALYDCAASLAMPITDTLNRVGVRDEQLLLQDAVARKDLWAMQTPQAFPLQLLYDAHAQCQDGQYTDDASLFQSMGHDIHAIKGSADNIKLTYKDDLPMIQKTLFGEYRTGQGFDVHGFCAGDSLTLAGVRIAHDFALQGHSDADVAWHALCDALLGAIACGDIGEHFSDQDTRWKGADSGQFLRHACGLIKDRGARIVNVDVTIICEKPKISEHRAAMKLGTAQVLDILPFQVNIKATTTEKLGFLGRAEGIAATAIATIQMPASI